MRKTLITFCFIFAYFHSVAQCNPESKKYKKIALVIGVNEYVSSTLPNPLNDAMDISAALKRLEFEVLTYTNTDFRTMKTTIEDWYQKIDNYDVALFYYAGHGASLDGESYIFSSTSNPKRPPDLPYETYPLGRLLSNLESSRARIRIALFDACRNNPFVRGWNRGNDQGGLSNKSASGTLIGYATCPGCVAADGDGRNGAYTAAILKYIESPNLSILQAFTKIGAEVFKASGNKQQPFISSSLTEDICLNPVIGESSQQQVPETALTATAKSLLLRVPFRSSIEDVVAFEFGEGSRNSMTYASLPQAIECTNGVVRYYWRYLKESKSKGRIRTFLAANGLDDKITDDTYIVYVFKDNKLARIDIRFFSGDEDFYNEFISAMSKTLVTTYKTQYKVRSEDFYSLFSSVKESGWSVTNLSISDEQGLMVCNNDWWTH